MDFGKAFSFITEDTNWFKKIAIGALLVLTGIGGIALTGWMIELVRRVVNKESEPLPDWSKLGEYIVSGLKIMVVVLVWLIPMMILIGIMVGGQALVAQQLNEQDAATIILIVTLCFSTLIFIYTFVIALLYGPLFGLMGEGVPLGKLLNPASSFRLLKKNFGGYLLAMIVGSLIASFLASIGTIACGIGAFFGSAYGTAVMGHLLGQAHAKAKFSEVV